MSRTAVHCTNSKLYAMRLFIRSAVFASLLVFLFSVTSNTATAQTPMQDTTHWNDEELYTDDVVPPNYFAVGGGALVGMFLPNLDAFNTGIARPFVGTDVKTNLLMLGGQGFIAIPWIKNVRVGGLGYGGTTQECCVDTTINGQKLERSLEYSVGYGGISLDYVLPLHMKRFNIVPGIILGLGTVNVHAEQTANRDFTIVGDFDGSKPWVAHDYHASFFLYNPQLQFEYNPLGYMMLRAYVGYQGTSMGSWKVDRDASIQDQGALKDVNGSGLTFGLGVFFGLF